LEQAVTIRVVIADDQRLVRAGFRKILEAERGIEVLGEADDGLQAIEQTHQHHPDVVLMDIRMPGIDGLEATRRLLREDRDRPRVLILTTFDLDEYVYESLHAGASGFLLKDAPPAELVGAVRLVAGGDGLLAPSITRKVIEEFVRRPPRSTKPPDSLNVLTPRELEVLALLGRGLSNSQIADELVVSDATVKTHVARVLMKLNLPDRVHAVIHTYETGLIEPGSQ
jgi:DNA-binding NarL/FixJ family response regulator